MKTTDRMTTGVVSVAPDTSTGIVAKLPPRTGSARFR